MSTNDEIQITPWTKAFPITQEEAEAHLHREGYTTFYWYDVPGASYPNHEHDRDECLWILKGELQITINNQRYNLKAGDKIYLPAHIKHVAEVPKTGGATYLIGQKKNIS